MFHEVNENTCTINKKIDILSREIRKYKNNQSEILEMKKKCNYQNKKLTGWPGDDKGKSELGERLIQVSQCEEQQENDWKKISTEAQGHTGQYDKV